MTGYELGDYVLVLGKVVGRGPADDVGYAIELFSKTDQYTAMVRPDLVIAKHEPPPPAEPPHEAIVKDKEGDLWHWSTRQSAWECVTDGPTFLSWDTLWGCYAPLKVYEATP